MRDTLITVCRQFLRPATIEHLRHWWASDGLFHHRIHMPDGAIDPVTVRQIFTAYGVNRGLRSGNEGLVAEILQDELQYWPEQLLDRAERARHIATKLSQTPGISGETITKGVLLSGVSKVVWFVRPQGWTLYDSFARRGLGSSLRATGRDEYEKYYNRLDFLRFPMAMDLAREVIAASPFPYLWPERIHDKYLMLCGHVPDQGLTVVADDAHDALLDLWSGFHGPKIITQIETLVDELVRAVCDQQAFQAHTLPRGQ